MATSQIGTLSGASMGSLVQGLFGKKKAPDYTPYENVNVGAEAGKAIQGNLDNWGDISDLVSKTNSLNSQQQKSMLEMALPGWNSMSRKMVGSYGDMFANYASDPYGMPSGLTGNIERLAAERGINTGGRGQFQDYSLMRDFGVGALEYGQYQAQMFNNMTNALMGVANFSAATPLLAQSFFVTPEQQIAQTGQANYLNWMGQNQNNAAKADAWNWNRQNLVGGISDSLVYMGGAMDAGFNTGSQLFNESQMNAAMQTNAAGNLMSGVGNMASGVGSLVGSFGGMAAMCWVAREVYGEHNPRWLKFRDWIMNRAPASVREQYAAHGPEVARLIRRKPSLAIPMREKMERILKLDAEGAFA